MEILIPENIIDSIDKKEDLIQKIIWHTKNNYEKYDENLIHKIVEKTFNILHDDGFFCKLQSPAGPRRACSDADPLESGATKERMIPEEIMQNLPISSGVFRKLQQPSVSPAAPHPGYLISEDHRDGDIQALLGAAENILSISDLNNLVVLNINKCYTQSYYDNKILYDTIILYIYGNLFKAHGFIDDVKIFLEKFNYFKKEQSCWWKDSLCKQNGNENILEEAPLLLNYYNFFLHAKNLVKNPTLKYTLDLVSNILENKIYVSGSGRKINTECRIMLCRYVCNIELIPRNNNYRKKVKRIKSKKSLSKLIISNNDTSKKILNRYPSENSTNHYDLRKTNVFPKFYGVFRKFHQPAASPATSHSGYSISEDRLHYCRSDGSAQYLNDGDIQALMGAAEKIGNHNLSFKQYISFEQSSMPQHLVKTIFGFITYHDFDFIEKNIFNHMYGPLYDSFHI